MSARTQRGGAAACLALFVALLALATLPARAGNAASAAEPPRQRVLLLNSYHPGFPAAGPMAAGIRAVFGDEGPVLDVEFMDTKRVPDDTALESFRRLLAHKLERLPPYDLVMVADDNALRFALEHRQDLFPGLPLVFTAVNDVDLARELDADPMVTGVVEQISIGETLALIRRLQPDLNEVAVVVDQTPSGKADHALLETLLAEGTQTPLRLLDLGRLSWDELRQALADLDPNSAVLRMGGFRDRDGRVLGRREAIRDVLSVSGAPVYGLREHEVGAGAVGGVVVSFEQQGREAARRAQRILEGASPADIPVLHRSPNRAMFDHLALQRLGIDESRLPADSIVINRPTGLLDEYREAVVATAAVVLLLASLVAWLAWQTTARRRVERRLRESEGRFRGIVEGTVYGVLVHCDSQPVFANQAYADVLGYASPADILALPSTDVLYAASEHERMREVRRAHEAGLPAPFEYEVIGVRRDGSHVVLRNVVHATRWQGRFAIQHNVVDVTEQRRAMDMLRESEERYRTLVENAPEAIMVIDGVEGGVVEVNDNTCTLFGMSREALTTSNPVDLSPPRQADGRHSAELAHDYIARAVAGERPVFEWLHRNAAGCIIPTEVRLVRLPAAGRTLVRGSIIDLSERMRTQRALEEKSAQLEATLENTVQGICMIDADLRLVAWNRRFLELLDLPEGRFTPGDALADVLRFNAERGEYGRGDPDSMAAEQLELVATARPHRFIRTRPDGTVLEVQGQPVPGGGMVRTYTDVTETHLLSRQLEHQARHDELTGLPNRREFEQRLERMLAEARGGGAVHAMCYLDLDQFKVINDTCGHVAGDELLRQLGAALAPVVRDADTLARLGGDEFGVLLEGCGLADAERVAESLRGAVESFRFAWDGKSFRVGVSIGVVALGMTSGSVTELLSRADAACYAAKDHGRNRIHVYDEDDSELARRYGEMQWVVHIQHALEEDRFELYSQAIVPVVPDSDEAEHHELLLRMYDSEGEPVRPGVFLPSAERYNLIGRLDRWVVESALEWLAAGGVAQRMGLCSINLSGQSVADDGLLEFIQSRLRASGIEPGRLCFEITETAAIANLGRATHFIGALKAMGCRFALDDFGSGLSSFAYLKTLPVDYLKIDGLFIKDIVDDPIDRAMVRSINEIGHLMGKRTIAEFVENDAILSMLRGIGVDYAQGYGIGRPQPLAEFGKLRQVRVAGG